MPTFFIALADGKHRVVEGDAFYVDAGVLLIGKNDRDVLAYAPSAWHHVHEMTGPAEHGDD